MTSTPPERPTPPGQQPPAWPPPDDVPPAADLQPPEIAGVITAAQEGTWQRLDPRMLLLGPINALKEIAFPFIIAFAGFTATSDQPPVGFALAGVVFMVLVGVLPWLTTRYLLTDSQLQVRTGLINKKRLTANLERVRTVDVTAGVLHRIIGLAKVEVGTGVDATRIELNALSTAQAEELANALRSRSAAARARLKTAHTEDAAVATTSARSEADALGLPLEESPDQIAALDWSWLRFAPLSLSRLVVLAGAFGAVSQFVSAAGVLDAIRGGYDWLSALGAFVASGLLVLAGLAVWLIVSMGGYAVAWAGFHLATDRTTVHLTAGLLTTRSITIELAKLRGVVIEEPVLLRLARGGQLTALATGVGLGGSSPLLPPAPITVCRGVGREVLRRGATGDLQVEWAGDPAGEPAGDPLTITLVPHGPAARRRCHVRAQLAQVFWLGLLAVATWWWGLGWWSVPIAALLILWGALVGEQAYRHLGHGLTADHLVIGDGLLTRRRTVVERAGILGWVIHQNLFQRRAGLVSVTVPLAAGRESVLLRDVPEQLALQLADTATPDLLAAFTARASHA